VRINSAKDDAAGLAISERFTTQIRGINQAARNANDGISLAQTAEGALGEIGNNLQRIRELAVQSRNATNSDSDRQALNAEVQLLKAEIQRVAEQTTFNGTHLLNGSFTNQAFQIGADQGQTISIAQITNANINNLGSWTSAPTAASVAGIAPKSIASAGTPNTTDAMTTDDLADAVVAGTAPDERFSYAASTLTVSIGGVDYTVDVDAVAEVDSEAEAQAALLSNIANAINNNDDMKVAGITMNSAGAISNAGAGFTITSSLLSETDGITVGEAPVRPAEAFAAIGAGQFQINGVDITVGEAKNAGDRAAALVNAINAKSQETGVTASLIEGKLQLTSNTKNFTIGGSLEDGLEAATGLKIGSSDSTADDAIAGATSYKAGDDTMVGFAALDISSQADADNAILAMDAALNSVNSARADLGAIQNRFSSTIANLNTSSENLSAARSRIRDVDYAQETAELTRSQILQQAGTAMLAQANQVPQNVLSLLQ